MMLVGPYLGSLPYTDSLTTARVPLAQVSTPREVFDPTSPLLQPLESGSIGRFDCKVYAPITATLRTPNTAVFGTGEKRRYWKNDSKGYNLENSYLGLQN